MLLATNYCSWIHHDVYHYFLPLVNSATNSRIVATAHLRFIVTICRLPNGGDTENVLRVQDSHCQVSYFHLPGPSVASLGNSLPSQTELFTLLVITSYSSTAIAHLNVYITNYNMPKYYRTA